MYCMYVLLYCVMICEEEVSGRIQATNQLYVQIVTFVILDDGDVFMFWSPHYCVHQNWTRIFYPLKSSHAYLF